jgi:SAM-dependent methyltransferase
VPPSSQNPREAWSPSLRRCVRLFWDFRHEQDDPDRFYGALARDSVGQLGQYVDLDGVLMLDIGGGPGYFREAFEQAGATYIALDADVGEMSGAGDKSARRVLGDGMRLPFRDDAFHLSYSSNVIEHVPYPWCLAEEMLRVTRPGGIAFVSYTVWFGPWGGHETAPWHYLGGRWARRRYQRKRGHEPKNKFGDSLFAVTVADGLRWARTQDAGTVVDVLPRYHPRWARWLLRVPALREVAAWNLVLVLRKT